MVDTSTRLIRNAEIHGLAGLDVLIANGRIEAIGQALRAPQAVEQIDAAGAALLPGLTDHHLHLASLAVSRASLDCGPDRLKNAAAMATALSEAAQQRPGQWLRGIGYHESVAGDIDAARLDQWVSALPLRIQHRGGRLWIFNSAAISALRVGDSDPLERIDGRLTGRLYEGDAWLRERMQLLGQASFPDLSGVSRELASYGITAVTDTTPHNSLVELQHFEAAHESGALLQSIRVMGDASLDRKHSQVAGVSIGARKFHLLESMLPEFEQLVVAIRVSHAAGRNVAFHCVTRTELAFALGALREAGVKLGDRIEHASITPPELLEDIRQLRLAVVTQPGFVRERGDQYLSDVEQPDQPWLYRLRAFLQAGVPLAASSDAPYSSANPWLGMQAAVDRRTQSGASLGRDEALSAEQALALYIGELDSPGQPHAGIRAGMLADLCLLPGPWQAHKQNLAAVQPLLTLRAGAVIWRA